MDTPTISSPKLPRPSDFLRPQSRAICTWGTRPPKASTYLRCPAPNQPTPLTHKPLAASIPLPDSNPDHTKFIKVQSHTPGP